MMRVRFQVVEVSWACNGLENVKEGVSNTEHTLHLHPEELSTN